MSNSLRNFKEIVSEFRGILLLALGSSSLLPILGKVAGFEPIWPNGVTAITALSTLIVLVFSFQFYWKASRRKIEVKLKLGLAICIVFSVIYFLMFSFFVFEIPTNGENIYLGCGWSVQSISIAADYLADPKSGCPGQFFKILEAAQYDSEVVWLNSSLIFIRSAMVFLWIALFSSFSYILAVFIVYHTNSKSHVK